MTYYIYILYSNSIDRYYVGYSSDPWLRLEQHISNSTDKYTGKAKDWILKAVFEVSNSAGHAIKIERFIKKQKSRNLILRLCDPEFIPTGVLAQLVRVPHLRDFFVLNSTHRSRPVTTAIRGVFYFKPTDRDTSPQNISSTVC